MPSLNLNPLILIERPLIRDCIQVSTRVTQSYSTKVNLVLTIRIEFSFVRVIVMNI